MNSEKTKISLTIFGIALITPFLVWILLRVVASYNVPSHDPTPWIQSLVEQPAALYKNDPKTSWVEVIGDSGGELRVKNGDEFTPLKNFEVTSEKVIFLVHAKGPTHAQTFFRFLKDRDLLSRALVLSPGDGFLKDLRFNDNTLALGCGQGYVIRWRALEQLGLQHLMTINMSGVWLDPAIYGSSLKTLARQFRDMKVPVFTWPVNDEIPDANFLVE